MALITLNPVIESVNKTRSSDTRRFCIPPLPVGTSDEYKLIVPANGILISLKVSTPSTNLDLYLFNRQGCDITDLKDFIYKKTGINKLFGYSGTGEDSVSPNEFNTFYENGDDIKDGAMYLIFDNNDVLLTASTFLWLTIIQD